MSLKFSRSTSANSFTGSTHDGRLSIGVKRGRILSAQHVSNNTLLADRGLATPRQNSAPMSYKDYLRIKGSNERNRVELALVKEQNLGNELRYERFREMSRGVGETQLPRYIVPRDAKTERRCQLFSIIVTILCLLAIFFFAMTHSVWSSVIMEDHYKSYCSVTDVIPLEGTADCKSERSRTKTEVHCTITCNYGIDESQTDNNFVLVGDNSFTMSCDVAKNSWAYDVMKICLSAPVSVDEQ